MIYVIEAVRGVPVRENNDEQRKRQQERARRRLRPPPCCSLEEVGDAELELPLGGVVRAHFPVLGDGVVVAQIGAGLGREVVENDRLESQDLEGLSGTERSLAIWF